MIPDVVYHGTGIERLDSIRKDGLLQTNGKIMSPYVKDTAFKDTARGKVHTTDEFKVACFFAIAGYESNAVVLKIRTDKMDKIEYTESSVFKKYREFKIYHAIPFEYVEKIFRVFPIPQSWTAITYPQTLKYQQCHYIREMR